MTKAQKEQFNRMLSTLKRIAKTYQTPNQIERTCEKKYGLKFEDALRYAYDNIQNDAHDAIRGVRAIKLDEVE